MCKPFPSFSWKCFELVNNFDGTEGKQWSILYKTTMPAEAVCFPALTSVPQDELLLPADFPSKGDGEFFHLSVPLWSNSFCALHQTGSDSSNFCSAFASVLA